MLWGESTKTRDSGLLLERMRLFGMQKFIQEARKRTTRGLDDGRRGSSDEFRKGDSQSLDVPKRMPVRGMPRSIPPIHARPTCSKVGWK